MSPTRNLRKSPRQSKHQNCRRTFSNSSPFVVGSDDHKLVAAASTSYGTNPLPLPPALKLNFLGMWARDSRRNLKGRPFPRTTLACKQQINERCKARTSILFIVDCVARNTIKIYHDIYSTTKSFTSIFPQATCCRQDPLEIFDQDRVTVSSRHELYSRVRVCTNA